MFSFIDSETSKANISVVDHNNGSYFVSFIPTVRSGESMMHILFDGEDIYSSPFPVVVKAGSPSPQRTTIHAQDMYFATQNNSFTLSLRDFVGNDFPYEAMSARINISLTHLKSLEEATKTLKIFDSGLARVDFIPQLSGLYLVEVLLDNTHVLESSFEMFVHPGPSKAQNWQLTGLAVGSNLIRANADQVTEILLIAKDGGNNNNTISVEVHKEIWLVEVISSIQSSPPMVDFIAPLTKIEPVGAVFNLSIHLTTATSYMMVASVLRQGGLHAQFFGLDYEQLLFEQVQDSPNLPISEV